MSRYFVSITLPGHLQKQVDEILPESRYWRKTDRSQLHLTLRFIGDLDDAGVKDIQDKLAKINIPEFTLRLNGIGFFPRNGIVRVIWIGAEKSSTLAQLQNLVDKTVSDVLNSESEHSFTPHITLARTKWRLKKEELLKLMPDSEKEYEFRVHSFQLMESRQGKNGAEHLQVKNYQLKPT